MARRRPHAFTLIELGLAVGLAAVLTLAIVVAAHAARRRAHHAACLTHARQIVFAFHRYAADHAGFLPPDDVQAEWWDRLSPFLAAPDLLVCPADPDFAGIPDGLSYFWRENRVIDPDDLAAHGADATNPAPYSFSGRHRDTIADPTLITVFEELAELHKPDRLNAATFAGSARSVTMTELEADLRRRVE